VLQCVAVRNSVLQYVAVCCSVSSSDTNDGIGTPMCVMNRVKCCSVLQCVAVCCSVLQCVAVCCSVLQCVAVCCSASVMNRVKCVVVCCIMLQCAAVCCSVLQCVAVCCSASQCVAV